MVDPNQRQSALSTARSAAQGGDFIASEAIVKAVLRQDPTDPEAAQLLARIVAREVWSDRAMIAPRSLHSFWFSAIPRSWRPAVFNLLSLYFLGYGLFQLARAVPVWLAQGPDAPFTDFSRVGAPITEPVIWGAAEGAVMTLAGVVALLAISVIRKRNRL